MIATRATMETARAAYSMGQCSISREDFPEGREHVEAYEAAGHAAGIEAVSLALGISEGEARGLIETYGA